MSFGGGNARPSPEVPADRIRVPDTTQASPVEGPIVESSTTWAAEQ